MKIQLNKEIKDLRGNSIKVSFPSAELRNKATGKDGKLDESKLPNETVRDVILNCLMVYTPETKLEAFYINGVASSVIENDSEVEFKKKYHDFLVKVLDNSAQTRKIDKDGKEEIKQGIYKALVIAQVLEAMGEIPDGTLDTD